MKNHDLVLMLIFPIFHSQMIFAKTGHIQYILNINHPQHLQCGLDFWPFCYEGIQKRSVQMVFKIGDVWFLKTGTPYEGTQTTIEHLNPRYFQVKFHPPLHLNGKIVNGKPMTVFDFLNN